MKIGMKRVAANTKDIYARWGLLDPIKCIKDLMGYSVEGKLDDKHRINKELRPDVYNYSVQATMEGKSYTLEITINEKDTDLSAMMNCKAEWCKHMLVVVRENPPAKNPK